MKKNSKDKSYTPRCGFDGTRLGQVSLMHEQRFRENQQVSYQGLQTFHATTS